LLSIDRRNLLRLGGAAVLATVAAPAFPAGQTDALTFLDPELRRSARGLLADAAEHPRLSALTLAEWRRKGAASVQPPMPQVPVQRRLISGTGGHPDVEVYIINAGTGGRPGILHTHGGGHVLGNARYELHYLQELASELDCVVVTVNYRLAPEVRFTGSTEDNYAALRWMHHSASGLGVDRDRIALLGESAGGTHAALLAIAARDREEVPVLFQALVYPMLDDRTGSTRHTPPWIGKVLWDGPANAFGWQSFLGTSSGGPDVPYRAVPARTPTLAGLPPTFIEVGGADLFMKEDAEYAQRLTEQGVPTELLIVPGAYHAFDRIAPETRIAQRFKQAKMDAFRRAFATA
jgi:acetyl esterase/lipase